MSTVDSATLLVDGPWEHRFVTANGARFHVALAGPDERDAPLVMLLHAIPQFWWAWRHQLPVLADAGYRVAAMDVRGTGGSDKPPVGYDVPTLAADVAGVIQSLGAASAVVVGNGTGGEIAWAMAGLYPQRVTAVGALGAPHPLDTHGSLRAAVRPTAARRLAFVQLPSFPERALMQGDLVSTLLHEWGGAPGWLSADAEATYRSAAQVPFAAHSAMEQMRWLVRSTPRLDGRRYLAAMKAPVEVPTLQLHGEEDRCISAAQAAGLRADAAFGGPEHRFQIVGGAGHFLPEEAPVRVTAILRSWLAEVAPA